MRDVTHRLTLFCVTLVILGCAALFVSRLWAIRPLYLDSRARTSFVAALSALRDDTGWGASAFDVRSVSCDRSGCVAVIDFVYRSNAMARHTETGWVLRWRNDDPAGYALER